MQMSKIITEITPLSDLDCFYLVDRLKTGFDYPIHRHGELEINLVCNCKGCQRIVGDSIETLDFYDLVIIGPDLEHGWLQNGIAQTDTMREITIQWSPTTTNGELLNKNQFASIRDLLDKSRNGLAFGQDTIKQLLPKFDELVSPQPGFMRYLKLLEIIFIMSTCDDCRILSTTSFARVDETPTSRRIKKVKDYVSANYPETLRLDDLASMVSMTPTSLSRFFRQTTGQTLSDYIIDTRLGHAIRLLVDTAMNCSEVCYACGFHNISNFNRQFRKKKGCSPMEFRAKYVKTKIII